MLQGGQPIQSCVVQDATLVGIWNDGLSDESVEDMTNSNLHVMRFLDLSLEDDVPGHSVLLRLRTLPQW